MDNGELKHMHLTQTNLPSPLQLGSATFERKNPREIIILLGFHDYHQHTNMASTYFIYENDGVQQCLNNSHT